MENQGRLWGRIHTVDEYLAFTIIACVLQTILPPTYISIKEFLAGFPSKSENHFTSFLFFLSVFTDK